MRLHSFVILFAAIQITSPMLEAVWRDWTAWKCNMITCQVQRYRICLTPHRRDGSWMCGDELGVVLIENASLGVCDHNSRCAVECPDKKWATMCHNCSRTCNGCARLPTGCLKCVLNETTDLKLSDCFEIVHAKTKTYEDLVQPEWFIFWLAPFMLLVYMCHGKLQNMIEAQETSLNAPPTREILNT